MHILSPAEGGAGSEGGASIPLPAGSSLARAADPEELAFLIRTFLAAGGWPRASGIQAQIVAVLRLSELSCASVADARSIVSAEGLLRRVERNLAAVEDDTELLLAHDSVVLVSAATSLDTAICARVAEESDLLRSLVLLVARVPRSRGISSSAALSIAAGARKEAADILARLTVSVAAAGFSCARLIDSLPDADLRAMVDASTSRGDHGLINSGAIAFLANCLSDAPLLVHRLVGAGFPLALAKLLAGEGFSEDVRYEDARYNSSVGLHRIVLTSYEHGPPLAAWAKPIVKPLLAAFARAARGAASQASSPSIGLLQNCTPP